MPKIQTYDVYTILAAGGTKTYSATDNIDVYEINANGGAVTLLADMTFNYSGTPKIGTEFKFQYSGGVTQNSGASRTISLFGTDLTDAQALSPLLITAYWNGTSWELTIIKDTSNNVTSVTTFGSTPNSAGLTVTGPVLNMQPASASFGGGVSTTTQTFAGAKTFDILSGNFSIDSNGIGIGTPATSRVYMNATKTFTTPITSATSDFLSFNLALFTYSGLNTEPTASSVSGAYQSRVTGTFTPLTVTGLVGAVVNDMPATTLDKSFGVRGSHTTGTAVGDTETDFNANFISSTSSNKTNSLAATVINSNYDFYSSAPWQNNGSASSTLFTIGSQFGFYCQDYSVSSFSPTIFGNGAVARDTANITSAWQLYMSGTNSTDIGSYIGNRLGIGFSTEPTTNTQITALLHIGAGTTSSAQIRLVVGVAPTSPNDGDIWLESNTNTGFKIRINGVTKTISLV